VARAELHGLARTMPGAVAAFGRPDGQAIAVAALGAMVDTIARLAASRLELPAPPPAPRSRVAVAEAFTTRLDGSGFEAPGRLGGELTSALRGWASPVLQPVDARLVVQLDPPDDVGAWRLSVFGPSPDGRLAPV